MDHETVMEIMRAMEEKGEDSAIITSIKEYVRAKQRDYAQGCVENNFKYHRTLCDCEVPARDILALLHAQDDPIAIRIFLEHEKELAKKDGDEDAADN